MKDETGAIILRGASTFLFTPACQASHEALPDKSKGLNRKEKEIESSKYFVTRSSVHVNPHRSVVIFCRPSFIGDIFPYRHPISQRKKKEAAGNAPLLFADLSLVVRMRETE